MSYICCLSASIHAHINTPSCNEIQNSKARCKVNYESPHFLIVNTRQLQINNYNLELWNPIQSFNYKLTFNKFHKC